MLPLVVAGILYLMNFTAVMAKHRPHWTLNLIMGAALLFACVISYNGIVALAQYFSKI